MRPAARERIALRPEAAPEGASDRRRVACPHFPACVGCPLVGRPYGEQLRQKQAAFAEALAAEPALGGARVQKIFGSPLVFGYRNQAKLVFRNRFVPATGSEVVLGVYRPGTHSVLPAHACAVHDPRLRPLLGALREAVQELGIPIFDERRRAGALRYALARIARASGAIHLTLVSATEEVASLAALVERLRRVEGRLESVFLCVNPTPGNTLLSSDIRRIFGARAALVDRFGRLQLESRPDAFVQANVEVATRIYATAEDWLDPQPADVLLDLFCGVGGLGLAVAPRVARVLGIEASPSAVECATANARRAHLAAARFVAGTSDDAAAIVRREGLVAGDGGALLVAVNPPRKGLSAATRDALVALAPRSILYLSCDPKSLVRDLTDLVGRGFAVERLQPFDMLPQTPHVEALALLARLPGPPT